MDSFDGQNLLQMNHMTWQNIFLKTYLSIQMMFFTLFAVWYVTWTFSCSRPSNLPWPRGFLSKPLSCDLWRRSFFTSFLISLFTYIVGLSVVLHGLFTFSCCSSRLEYLFIRPPRRFLPKPLSCGRVPLAHTVSSQDFRSLSFSVIYY